MTIIDALIVELGLDATELEKKAPVSVDALKKLEKQGDQTEKQTKKISNTSKETARSIDNLSRVVATFLTIVGGTMALKSFVSDFIDTNAQLDRLSKNLNLSVSDISAWSNATEKLGGTAQGLQGTLDMLSRSQTQLMLTGESNLIPYFSALGVSIADLNGKARPVTDILLDLSDHFSHMDRTTANNFGRMMGIDQGTMNLLLQGRKELELEIKRQKEQSVVTKAQAEEASRLQKQIVGVKQTFQALGRTLLMEAAPTLEKVFGALQAFGTWAIENKEFIGDFLKVLTVGLGVIALVTIPINLTVAAVVALAAGIALLWQDYQVWKRGGESLIDWGKWEPGITKATNALKALGDAAKTAWTWMEKFLGHGSSSQLNGGAGHLGTSSDRGKNGARTQFEGAGHLGTAVDTGAASAKQIQDYFVKAGWTPAQAAGIAANLLSESSGLINKPGDDGLAYGLAQWHPDRQADFKKFAGKDIRDSSLWDQLAFVQFELTQGKRKSAGDALRGATSAKSAGDIVSRKFEGPRDVEGEASKRGAYAQTLMGIHGASSFAGNAPGGSQGQQSSVDRSVQTTIGDITIITQATDAEGIASDMKRSLDFLFPSQANFGLVP